ncbi:MAG: hypothetical protein NWF04_00860 [Candidatus Bathyarchaeota archaeon]|nr:hypothetical protein [Candidatus Bathyarchaeota archaeon]
MPVPTKTWKTRPAYYYLMEILNKKGDLPENELFNALQHEYGDLGYKDFISLLLNLEVAGKIRTTSLSRGKKRIELVH